MFDVMVVDDEKAIRDNISNAIPFKDCGFTVCGTARNGEDALRKLYELKPDLILLDVNMPIMDGIDFLQYLRSSEYKDTKVIMLSGYNNFEYAQKAIRYDVKAYLSKPIDEEEAIPLLDEIEKELKNEISAKNAFIIKNDLKLFEKLYNGRHDKREDLQNYFLLHCVILDMNEQSPKKNHFDVLNNYLTNMLGEDNYALAKSRGCIHTYLINKNAAKHINLTYSKCAKKLICELKKACIKASVLMDMDIFSTKEESFNKDFTKHLYYMSTEVFYSDQRYIEYCYGEAHYRNSKIETKKAFLESLKRNLLELDFKKITSDFEKMSEEIVLKKIGIEYIHEISFRIYYLIIDVLTTLNIKNEQEKNFKFSEWTNCPFLVKYSQWKEQQTIQLNKIFKLVEAQRIVKNKRVYRDIINYLHCHYKETITIKSIADKFYLNATYVGRAFKNATGVTIKQYLNELRINESKKLLLNTNKMVYEIANEVGFNESKYFISKFLKSEGVSPTQYRKVKLSD